MEVKKPKNPFAGSKLCAVYYPGEELWSGKGEIRSRIHEKQWVCRLSIRAAAQI
jgi:hypothetical protein